MMNPYCTVLVSLSFAQFKKGKCYCCGKTDHPYQDCPKRSALTKDQWWINKQKDVQQYNQLISDIRSHMITEANTSSNASTADTDSSTTASAYQKPSSPSWSS